MTLNDAYLVSQIAAAAAVIGSLVFVGMQIRHQTTATKAQTEQAIAANWMALAQVIGQSADAFSAGIVSASERFSDLSDADRMRFLTAIFALFKHYENMYLQHVKGRIDKCEWETWSNHLEMYFHQPGVQNWWALRKSAFSPAFQAFLDSLKATEAVSPAALHEAALLKAPA